MRSQFIAFFCLWILIHVSHVCAQVELPNSVSPDKRYAVFIETDKDQPTWKPKPDEAVNPEMWIEDLKTQKRVCTWKSDLDENDDAQPLRTHCKCCWAPDSHGLALFEYERFDNGFAVYRRLTDKGGTAAWTKCDGVDDFGIIQKLTPHFKYFKGRPHSVPIKWLSPTQLMFTSRDVIFTDDPLYPVSPGGEWRFTVDYSSKRAKLLKVVEEDER